MKRVLVKSVYDAFEYAMQHYYPAGMEDMVEKSDTYAVISIQDTHTKGFGITFSENKYCKGVLTLYFDDIVREVEDAVLFSDDMACAVIKFILLHKYVDTLLIHCYAGQSRSRAIGAFAVKILGGDNSAYFEKYNPNIHVYNTLAEVWNDKSWKEAPVSDESLYSILRTVKENNKDVKYTGNEFAEVMRRIQEFCSRSPTPAFCISYLYKACEIADLYGEMLSITEEEKTPDNMQIIAELAAEISEIVD